jgi:hypothetical protein
MGTAGFYTWFYGLRNKAELRIQDLIRASLAEMDDVRTDAAFRRDTRQLSAQDQQAMLVWGQHHLSNPRLLNTDVECATVSRHLAIITDVLSEKILSRPPSEDSLKLADSLTYEK